MKKPSKLPDKEIEIEIVKVDLRRKELLEPVELAAQRMQGNIAVLDASIKEMNSAIHAAVLHAPYTVSDVNHDLKVEVARMQSELLKAADKLKEQGNFVSAKNVRKAAMIAPQLMVLFA